MSESNFSYKPSKTPFDKRVNRLHAVTLVLFGIIFVSAIVVVAWFAGEDRISQLFALIHDWQMYPPMWLEVPITQNKYLLLPTIGLLLAVFLVMKISPQPRIWSQRLVVIILIIVTLRYVLWRSLSTLNLIDPLNGVFSLGLFFAEMLVIVNNIIQLLFMFDIKERHQEADVKSQAVVRGSFLPFVDIFIPTYNEPTFILRRTIIGCQALDYTNKKIYLLDDKNRPEMKYLAEELGCYYITRPDNSYAKAGNLNNAIAQTHGELIVIFDADFVPTKNFLTRTVGFFQDKKIGLIQTQQSFYNSDPIARNLGLENIVTPEGEVFHRHIQTSRDPSGSAICSGTSFVVRRSALEEIGGFVTESLSEDYFTGIRLSAQGYRLIYLNEKLSAGLAPENIPAYATQRLRWQQGTVQALFIKTNPLKIPGLNFMQRLAGLGGVLYWCSNLSRIYFLLIPLAYSFFDVIPIRSNPAELIFFLLPYYLLNIATFSWLNYRSCSIFISDIYSLIICFPLALNFIQVMIFPFAKGFKVTPKGMVNNRYSFNWNLALPLIILFVVNAVTFWRSLNICIYQACYYATVSQFTGISLGWLWSIYNLVLISITLLILLDAPKADMYEWFDLRRVTQLKIGEDNLWGVTKMISEGGAEIAIAQKFPVHLFLHQPIDIKIVEENLQLAGEIVSTGIKDDFLIVRVRFQSVSLNQYRRLVEMLFCRPGQWKHQNTPGELYSLFLLLKILLRPRILFDKKIQITPMKVSNV
ncbi:UDP-glucose-beta-D-glucan glucosyltransferase [Nostoc linckia z18]|uniref:UDP-glucose-beta-D-glucan glucosyltransferase n=2 Tax=Nostoc linckia TaxID=92942 RepID=A0A9Q6EMI8_NOSLI|nr:glycosyltransferase [Nostoc linckia]PHK46272.1 UDP-glucose-beta-D-glucan glucosyltransferase [Nostoc linckia z16]PHJ66527.1 UDP-glucose-beta-D-glucan glucosyltransferase [Nostoc linckia z1]PHJ71402.1 UDP-glucose-beta-D-glucan glucosyltransferase [Nostoc linckia z3]PHJ75434.1 UDP-glucose-beta-D-glucan glucosyltransferase [Nostoc linckia z2]PHJ84234.1 UDP-glucose-beta-D-glucan glucosyltransferase [Nostoc linckia z4]